MIEKNLQLKFTYEVSTDSAYLYIDQENTKIQNSITLDQLPNEGDIVLDFSKEGKIVGIEILNASKVLPSLLLK